MVSLKFTATHKCHDKTLNSFRNTLLFGAKFLIICLISAAKFLPRGKTFFLAAKLSSSRQNFSPRQNFLSRGKLLKARQIFLSGGKTFLPLQNFSSNLCTTSGGGPLGEGDRAAGSDSFIDPIFQVFARSRSHFSTFF